MWVSLGGYNIKYKNPLHRRKKGTHLLEISCGSCKTPVAVYEKVGKGNLIKMQIARIVESEMDLTKQLGYLVCPNCKMELARKGTYNGYTAYWTIRGRINTKRV